MGKVLATLGVFLAGASALVFFAGRGANRRERGQKIPAKQAAAMLAEAWADHRTRV